MICPAFLTPQRTAPDPTKGSGLREGSLGSVSLLTPQRADARETHTSDCCVPERTGTPGCEGSRSPPDWPLGLIPTPMVPPPGPMESLGIELLTHSSSLNLPYLNTKQEFLAVLDNRNIKVSCKIGAL